jgi:flagellar basal-body rod protein FlgC
MNLFDVAQRAMSAQLVRMNAAASNLANAGSVTGSEAEAYRPMRPVFAQELDQSSGLATVRVAGIQRSEAAPEKRYDPGNPLADEDGNVFEAPVDENAEMVEMLESARQYQNMVEALQTAKQLMLETMRMK